MRVKLKSNHKLVNRFISLKPKKVQCYFEAVRTYQLQQKAISDFRRWIQVMSDEIWCGQSNRPLESIDYFTAKKNSGSEFRATKIEDNIVA